MTIHFQLRRIKNDAFVGLDENDGCRGIWRENGKPHAKLCAFLFEVNPRALLGQDTWTRHWREWHSATPSHTMRQTDFALGPSRTRLYHARRRALYCILFSSSVPTIVTARIVHRAKILRAHIAKLRGRSLRIGSREFDLSTYDERRSLRDFCFLTSEIRSRLVDFFGWDKESTSRNSYACSPILATCVVLRRLASPARWEDLAEEFGKFPAQLCEIFCESLERMVGLRGLLILS